MQITPHLSQTGASSTQVELLLFAGVVAIGLLAALAQRSRVPYPIFLVLAGLALGFLPGAPDVTLDPQLIFLIFLPPLLYAATYFASLSELRASAQPIAAMAIGLVMVTTFAVAIVVHTMVPHMSWAVAFTLGAIVSPTDAVAATTIMSRLNVPRRVAHLVDGESLLNDGTALVVYRLAVVAVVSGVFSIADAGWLFAASILGGVAVGVLAGTCIAFVRRRNHDGPTDVLLSLLSGYVAYLPAEALGVSGVLAAVTTGVWLGWRTPSIVRDPQTRLQIRAVWVNVQFVINVVLFLLVGLQLPGILRRLNAISYGELLWWSFAISATLVVTRLLWVFPAAYLPRRALFGNVHIAGRGARGRGRWRLPLLTSWVGMRGAVTLAAALALPLHTDSGAPFPHRDLLVFLAFGSIVFSLVVQGLTLPWLIGTLGVEDDGETNRLEARARAHAARAAVIRIDELADEDWVRTDTAASVRGLYNYRQRRFEALAARTGEHRRYEQRSADYQRLLRELHEAERSTILRMRDDGEITDEVMSRIQRDLDLDDTRLED